MPRPRKVLPPAAPQARARAARVFEYKGFWIEPLGRGASWYVLTYDQEKRSNIRWSLRTPDLDEAKEHVISIANDQEKKLAAQAEATQVTAKRKRQEPELVSLHGTLEWYWETHGKDTAAAGTQRERLNFWKAYFGAETTIADVDRTAIDGFVKFLREHHDHADSTIDRTLVVGRAALNLLRDYDLVTWVPKIKMIQTQEQREAAKPLGRELELDELARLFAAQPTPHVRHLMWIMLGTLARPGAVLELRKHQVDYRRDRVEMNPPGRVQTKKRRPILPLVPFLKAILTDIETSRAKELEEVAPEEFYYVSYRGSPVKSTKTSFRKMVIRAGFAEEVERDGKDVIYDREPITPYSIRHTMGRELRAAGFPLDDVGDYLGHKGKKGVTIVYAPDDPRYLKAQADAVDRYMRRLAAEIAKLNPARTVNDSGTLAGKSAGKRIVDQEVWFD